MRNPPPLNYNAEQERAVTFPGRHLLVLAGAGTGKTHTIIGRALWLIEQGVEPERILLLSFTRKSAAEIVERIHTGATKGLSTEGLTGQTFHSWCMGLVKGHPEIFPQSNFTVLDEDDREGCIKLLIGKDFKDSQGKAIKPSQIAEVYSYAVNARVSLTEAIRRKMYNDTAGRDVSQEKEAIGAVIRKFLEYKSAHNYMDYDDILQVVANAMARDKGIGEFIGNMYDHILVDEMQDTNPLQYKLLEQFYTTSHLFCVGDDAQSIYGFRGADFHSIHNFAKVVPGGEVCRLTLNYRSTQEILDVSNWLLERSPLEYGKKLHAQRGSGHRPVTVFFTHPAQQGRHITDNIIADVEERGGKYSDHMVLGRSRHVLLEIESACLRRKIPYNVFGGLSLMQSAHIRDVVAAMRIVANHRDELAWMRYLQIWEGIGERRAGHIIDMVLKTSNFDEALLHVAENIREPEAALTLSNLQSLVFHPARAIDAALETMAPRLEKKYKDEWEWRKEDFPILREVAMDSGSVSEFVAEYIIDPKLETTRKERATPEDGVTLSTIHSAKGLEAPTCYLVNVTAGSYPTPRAIKNGPEAVEEERRCLYVAMTRAKDHLYIYRGLRSTHAVAPMEDDAVEAYFLNSIPAELTSTTYASAKPRAQETYQGPKAETNLTDFNFD